MHTLRKAASRMGFLSLKRTAAELNRLAAHADNTEAHPLPGNWNDLYREILAKPGTIRGSIVSKKEVQTAYSQLKNENATKPETERQDDNTLCIIAIEKSLKVDNWTHVYRLAKIHGMNKGRPPAAAKLIARVQATALPVMLPVGRYIKELLHGDEAQQLATVQRKAMVASYRQVRARDIQSPRDDDASSSRLSDISDPVFRSPQHDDENDLDAELLSTFGPEEIDVLSDMAETSRRSGVDAALRSMTPEARRTFEKYRSSVEFRRNALYGDDPFNPEESAPPVEASTSAIPDVAAVMEVSDETKSV